jgi:large subunit ribosomal protein L15
MPFKRGFTNIWSIEYQILNVDFFNTWPDGVEVTPEKLLETRAIRRKNVPVKILGNGTLEKPVVIQAHKFSASAREKIEAAGGSIRELPWVVERHSRSRGPNPSMRDVHQSNNA